MTSSHSDGPDFIGIGAQKAATTWMFRTLRAHPEVGFPSNDAAPGANLVDGKKLNTWPKEVHFLSGHNSNLSWGWYFSLFSKVDRREKVLGEITPDYLAAPEQRIAYLADRLPHLKLLLNLRDPIERDWSAIRMWAKRNDKLEDIKAMENFACSDHVKNLGRYKVGLERWLSHYSDENMIISTVRDIELSPRTVIGHVSIQLGIDESFYDRPEMEGVLNSKIHVGESANIPGSIYRILEDRHEETYDYLRAKLGRGIVESL